MNQIAEADPAGPLDTRWQPLPARARNLFLVGILPLAGAVGLAAGGILAAAFDQPPSTVVASAALGAFIVGSFGLWFGLNQYRRISWRLDGEGLAVRRGKLWQRETRVPASRVQHLDLKRGPLQRRRDLATLVVHTAGTRHGAVTVPHLDAADAERLRDRLGRQIDRDDD